uniref:3-deoxy-7-phosphoheptulonate synthase n=1 Tax=Mucochytrium quahogii TaxID=96639 RepID=A0A7S2SHX1_9STRA|mmetsp:Transcript_19048/g.31182  ORF Transcript_19048/g.31182 Transcript_19048/m.31182 type:complete len:369 (-) Transcript_19048:39-1145(-)|eukprot:CAMPEP_0203755220 /NCGR_PEP_ID=MMETSP0098-20131031/8702_1 /ASSEMBLY_ACC=CAM_ASM_000208 /TAXON_ID=96639 /ORGANISM=" , Strain NY0313808BC1" /LENGTH=368 /DNA_ID=CAMNT_0050646585 /DNA_START=54 /DNA_END=1160 /DNA_ORIENTATION=+
MKRKISEAMNGVKKYHTSNLRVTKLRPLIPPAILAEEIPVTPKVSEMVEEVRFQASQVIHGKDDRALCIVGPCSIHDPKAALGYAKELKKLADEFKEDLLVVMRVYFEKPRTTVGWKGLINDPEMDGSFQINAGLRIARQLLLDINSLGLGVGTEFLDSISPQFTSDLVSWGAIGARTTESQIHRELASGLSCPVGFKNGTGGSIKIAVDAIKSSSNPHCFLGVTSQGLAAIVETTGNEYAHIILRGGNDGPNYEKEHVLGCLESLDKAKIKSGIIIDCSHGNSNKDHKNQPKVAADIAAQWASGQKRVSGVMIESNICEGKQTLDVGVTDPSSLKYGMSVTDACIDLATTKEVLKVLAEGVRARRKC